MYGKMLYQPLIRSVIEDGADIDPTLAHWVQSLRQMAGSQGKTTFQRRQFAKFVKAMQCWFRDGNVPRLPQFHVARVNAWRVFTVMYPQSIQMYQAVIRYSQIYSDIMFASAMLPMLANASNRNVSGTARDVINLLKSRRDDFSNYAYRRELLRSPAEAGDHNSLVAVTDLVTRPESRRLELTFLSNYGWTLELLEVNLFRKLQQPTLRDERPPIFL